MDSMHTNGLTFVGGQVFGVLVEGKIWLVWKCICIRTLALILVILYIGYRCDLYVMDLDYTFIYRLYKLGTFYIPRNRYDFGCLTDLVEHMLTLRELFDGMVVRCHDEVVTSSNF
jgi:hypothetical protein